MSAPWKIEKDGATYLNSQLTCGECKHWDEKYSRGKSLSRIGLCAQFDDHYSGTRIGCLAFAPKEQK